MQEKTFFEIFSRYSPSDDKRTLLERARVKHTRVAKEPSLRIEVELSFPSHESPDIIYDIMDGTFKGTLFDTEE